MLRLNHLEPDIEIIPAVRTLLSKVKMSIKWLKRVFKSRYKSQKGSVHKWCMISIPYFARSHHERVYLVVDFQMVSCNNYCVQ